MIDTQSYRHAEWTPLRWTVVVRREDALNLHHRCPAPIAECHPEALTSAPTGGDNSRKIREGRNGSAASAHLAIAAISYLIALCVPAAAVAASGTAGAAAKLTTLVNFNGTNGANPYAGLIVDASGNLFGTTETGGASAACMLPSLPVGCGTVFEIAKTATGYASNPTTLVSFNRTNGATPDGGLIADASGNLFGTAAQVTNGFGTVFEIVKTAAGYASTPTGLVTFDVSNGSVPLGSLIANANGDLFGTTETGGGGTGCKTASGFVLGCGTVFEVPKTAIGYASHPATLVSFNGTNGQDPNSSLIADANGNLFGTTHTGGASTACSTLPVVAVVGCGTVFEIAKTAAGYASLPTTLVSFNGTDGAAPLGSLIADAAGNLFGTTLTGGASNACTYFGVAGCGTVFEIFKTRAGYASIPTTLISFNGTNGSFPFTGLIADAAGNLYGTTSGGGGSGHGTVFEIAKTAAGYASTPTTLVSFDGANGADPSGTLIADAGGNLFGTTFGGGTHGDGTVFELSGAGVPLSKNPQTADFNADRKSDLLCQNANGAVAVWEINGLKAVASGGSGNPGAGWRAVGDGYFYGSPYADILLQNLGGAVEIWQMNGWKKVGGGVVGTPAVSWHAVAAGDFNGDGYSDILWQNTNGAVAIWEMDGLKPIASAVVGNPGAAWHVIRSGDFNGDGKSDILFQNTNGAVAVWEMNGLKVLASATIGNPGTAWHVVGSGDFNRDGYADILFQNTNGAVAIWEMNGLKRIGGGTVGNPGATWHVVGTGDYNGDGYSDILLQNANGAVEIWEMDGVKRIGGGTVGNPGPAWHAIGE